jgi:hypothetical protein
MGIKETETQDKWPEQTQPQENYYCLPPFQLFAETSGPTVSTIQSRVNLRTLSPKNQT